MCKPQAASVRAECRAGSAQGPRSKCIRLLLTAVNSEFKDAEELVKEFPTAQRGKYTRQLATHKTARKNLAKALSSPSSALASTSSLTAEDAQRERLLLSTGRLDASSARLDNSLRVGQETENTGAAILEDLKKQREQIERTREELDKSEGYVDKSLKTLKEMSRR
jgi:vesicle transport through interaction with t-SNAREs protein 1